MEDAEAGSGEGSSGASAAERGVMRDTLRELLFEIPGFQTLAERGIPRELIPDPPAGASPSGWHEPASESGGSRPSAGEASSSSGTGKKKNTGRRNTTTGPLSGGGHTTASLPTGDDGVAPARPH